MAIGSGKNFALAFMDTGMSAEEAVRATCKRDIYTGGTIRTFKIINQQVHIKQQPQAAIERLFYF